MTAMRCGFVALIGAPNAGKSTLLNTLVGTKLAIVTQKVQTTRTRMLGIAIEDQTQIIYVDTPGIFAPKRRLDRAMVSAAWSGAEDADLIVLLIDVTKGIGGDEQRILDSMKQSGKRGLLALNKVDLVNKQKLLKLATRLDATGLFDEIFMISALTGDGVEAIKKYLTRSLPEGHWLYPEDQMSDVAQRVIAAEITREKIYLRLHQELPYATSVETEKWTEQPDGSIRIEQIIFVERKSQKGIVIGKGGASLKTIGGLAREEMEEIFGTRVHLFLFVKISANWADDKEHYSTIGLDYVD